MAGPWEQYQPAAPAPAPAPAAQAAGPWTQYGQQDPEDIPDDAGGMSAGTEGARHAVGMAEAGLSIGSRMAQGMGEYAAENVARMLPHGIGPDGKPYGPTLEGTKQVFHKATDWALYDPKTKEGQEHLQQVASVLDSTVGRVGKKISDVSEYLGDKLPGDKKENKAQVELAINNSLPILSQGAKSLLKYTGNATGEAISKAIRESKDPEQQQLLAKMVQEGIPIPAYALTDNNLLKRFLSFVDQIPGTKGNGQQIHEAFQKYIGRIIGADPKAKNITQNAWADAMSKAGGIIGDMYNKYGLKITSTLGSRAQEIAKDAAFLHEADKNVVLHALGEIQGHIVGNTVPGQALKAWNTRMRLAISAASQNAPLRELLHDVKSAVSDAFKDQLTGAERTNFELANSRYMNGMKLVPLAATDFGKGLSADALKGVTTRTNEAKQAAAWGRDGELGQAADMGQFLKRPGSSGTAENNIAMKAAGLTLLGGAAYTHVLAGLGTMALARLINVVGPKLAKSAFGRARLDEMKETLNQKMGVPPFTPGARNDPKAQAKAILALKAPPPKALPEPPPKPAPTPQLKGPGPAPTGDGTVIPASGPKYPKQPKLSEAEQAKRQKEMDAAFEQHKGDPKKLEESLREMRAGWAVADGPYTDLKTGATVTPKAPAQESAMQRALREAEAKQQAKSKPKAPQEGLPKGDLFSGEAARFGKVKDVHGHEFDIASKGVGTTPWADEHGIAQEAPKAILGVTKMVDGKKTLIGGMDIVKNSDGAVTVSKVNVEAGWRGRGIARKMYEEVNKDHAIRRDPAQAEEGKALWDAFEREGILDKNGEIPKGALKPKKKKPNE